MGDRRAVPARLRSIVRSARTVVRTGRSAVEPGLRSLGRSVRTAAHDPRATAGRLMTVRQRRADAAAARVRAGERITALEEQREQLRHRVAALVERSTRAEERARTERERRDRAIEQRDVARDRLREGQDRAAAQIERLKASNTSLRRQRDEARDRLVEARGRSAEVRDRAAARQALLADQNAALRAQRDEAREKLRGSREHLASRLAVLRAANDSLRSQRETVAARALRLRELLDLARERADSDRTRRDVLLDRQREAGARHRASMERAAERQRDLVSRVVAARERLTTTSGLWNAARAYFPLFRQGLLFDEIEKSDVDLSADTYLCLLPSTVPAGFELRRRHGGRVICDCVENVEVERHSLAPKLRPAALQLINSAAHGALTRVDGMMTVSASVAVTLQRFGPPVRLQPNFRRFEVPERITELRARFGMPADATVLVTSGNIVEGFEAVLDGLALLPDSIHLVALARFSPASYAETISDAVTRLGLQHRVHLSDFVPYDELAGLLADADLGIITLDPDNPNHSVALPNRVFDFVTAGLPFVAPPLAELRAFVAEHGCGAVVEEVTGPAWAAAIRRLLDELPRLREATQEARRRVTWESLEDGLVDFLGSPRTVTMLGFRDLTRYQRFLRIATSLSARGIAVKAVFFSENPLPVEIPGCEFYHFSDRYGRGPGLTRVA